MYPLRSDPYPVETVLHQGRWWLDGRRIRWSPRAMGTDHLRAAYPHVERMARRWSNRLWLLVLQFPPSGDAATDAVESFLTEADHDAIHWEDLPVARMLREELERRGESP